MSQLSKNGFFVTAVVLVTSVQFIVHAAYLEIGDVPTNVPSKLADIPVVLPKSWPTVDPTYIPENISAEVIEGSKEVVKRLKARTGYLHPNRKPHDFHNFERNRYGIATSRYCEYGGRYIRKGGQKYMPELNKVVYCKSVDPLWVAVYICDILLTTPEKYKDLTELQAKKCIKLCQSKPGSKTKPPMGLPDWQVRLNNVSERIKTEEFTTPHTPRYWRRLKPLNPTSPTTKKRKQRTYSPTTPWDGEWDPKWDYLRSKAISMRERESSLRAAGLWFTTPTISASTRDSIQDLLRSIKGATVDGSTVDLKAMPSVAMQTALSTHSVHARRSTASQFDSEDSKPYKMFESMESGLPRSFESRESTYLGKKNDNLNRNRGYDNSDDGL